MPVWKSLANRCNSFTFFAVEQGKTRENVDCPRRGGQAREGTAGEQGTEVCSRYDVEGAGIDHEHTSVPCSPARLLGKVVGTLRSRRLGILRCCRPIGSGIPFLPVG